MPDLFALVRPELERMNAALLRDLDATAVEVQELIEHVGQYRGKQLRPALVFLWAHAAGGVNGDHFTVAKVIELIHLATLVHDDVLDGADRRRRVPTLNALHGNEVPVLLGDYIYARAFHMSVTMADLACSRRLADVTRLMCQGEITQILHRFDFSWDEDRYFAVIRDKTATLYAAACELGVHYAHGTCALTEAAQRYGEEIGIAFQIVDDCLDLEGDEDEVGKSLGTDLAKGKLTLPLLFLLREEEPARRLRRLMEEGRGEFGLRRLRDEFDLAAAVSASHEVAQRHVERARAALEPLPAGPARAALLDLADYVIQRRL
ncbi:MAG TPA: polyprenyl synthetase family protein [Planctomycetota bacterium]|nr:polyprenyl synthetase family protein [Planctomycetota bacterium]